MTDDPKKMAKRKAMATKQPLLVEKADGSIGQWGNDLPDNPPKERQIKMSQKSGDVMGQKDFDDAVADLPAARQQEYRDAATKLGQVTPDMGDGLKKIRDYRKRKNMLTKNVDNNLRESM